MESQVVKFDADWFIFDLRDFNTNPMVNTTDYKVCSELICRLFESIPNIDCWLKKQTILSQSKYRTIDAKQVNLKLNPSISSNSNSVKFRL